MRVVSVGIFLLLTVGCTAPRPAVAPPVAGPTYGIATGDVSATGAVIWLRCDAPSPVHVMLTAADGSLTKEEDALADAAHDMVAKVAFDGLKSKQRYSYRAWCVENEARKWTGTFSTAPAPAVAAPVRFTWGGDLGGQNVCRDAVHQYSIFDTIAAGKPDFFIALGDLIYADDPCLPVGRYGNSQIPGPPAPALTRTMFADIWKYNRADPVFQRLLAAVPMYPVWDDHEINNDAGPYDDTLPIAPRTHLLQPALQAYLDYQPVMLPKGSTRLYRSVRWGRHLELFFLDLRQYRDSTHAPDRPAQPKTMLGEEQRRWFLEALRKSDATWKIVVSSVPLSIPTGASNSGHDGWTGMDTGDGFERERAMILDAMRRCTSRNFVWITTDVHFGAVFRYRPAPDDPEFVFDELISGPLNAGIFPLDAYDKSLGTERLFKYAPATADSIADFDEAMSWFNFGTIEVNESGELTSKLINGRGKVVYEAKTSPH